MSRIKQKNIKTYEVGKLKGSLTEKQYEITLNQMNLSDKSKDISYGVLVAGANLSFYAKKYNISNSAVHQLCKRFKNKFLDDNLVLKIPKDLNIVIALIPATQMPQFEKSQDDIFSRYQIDRKLFLSKVSIKK